MLKIAEVYIAEWFIFTRNFFESQNPRFIIESGFKSRAGYNGARTVVSFQTLHTKKIWENKTRYILKAMQKGQAEKFAVDLRTKQLCIENYVSHSMARVNLNLTAIL